MKIRMFLIVLILSLLCTTVCFGESESVPESMDAFSVITFGRYEQDNDLNNGQEPVEWIILDLQGDYALLLSKYGLDAKQYNTTDDDITWEDCSLRAWLNSEFLIAAFSEKEQQAILATEVDNSAAQGYSGWETTGGNNTQDRVFLLSCAEAIRYFGVKCLMDVDDSAIMISRAAPTAYAIAQGSWANSDYLTEDGSMAGWWWLRSPGVAQFCAAFITEDGSLFNLNASYTGDWGCGDFTVRPAIWVNLKFIR